MPAPRRSGASACSGLAKTRAQWGGKLNPCSRGKVDDQFLEELETLLLTSDVGIEATTRLLDDLKVAAEFERLDTPEGIQGARAHPARPCSRSRSRSMSAATSRS